VTVKGRPISTTVAAMTRGATTSASSTFSVILVTRL
jgi:hypothetical protein